MEVTRSRSLWAGINRYVFGRDTYVTNSGCKITMKKDTGKVNVKDDGSIFVTGAENVMLYDSKGDDTFHVTNSKIKGAFMGRGENALFFDKCEFAGQKLFEGCSAITTRGRRDESTTIVVNGDFSGRMNLQQGAGKGWGNDDYAHKDKVIITGNNNGYIQVDGCDKVAIRGKEKGHISNVTVYYV